MSRTKKPAGDVEVGELVIVSVPHLVRVTRIYDTPKSSAPMQGNLTFEWENPLRDLPTNGGTVHIGSAVTVEVVSDVTDVFDA